jgi:calcium-dependent protein kinase
VLAKVRRANFNFRFIDWKGVTEDAKDLIRQLLQSNPLSRFTAEQALQHSWMNVTAPKVDVVAASLHHGFVERLRDFQAASRFKKVALHVIAERISEKQIKSMREAFIALDLNDDGLLTIAEIQAGLIDSGCAEIPADLQELISEADYNKSGVIDYTEFLAATLSKKLYMQEDVCWKAFSVFDQNGDGMISKEELKQVLNDRTIEEELGMECIDVLMKEVDANGDGAIDFEEFMSMMQSCQSDNLSFVDSSKRGNFRRGVTY